MGNPMIKLLRLEGALVFAGLIALYFALGYSWLPFIILFFAPDLSFIAYALGPKIGAIVYNTAHFYGTALALGLAGLVLGLPYGVEIGLVFAAHTGFDRMLGYGLKHFSGFKNTHLGDL
ncbi:MAG: DUF4260 domain-containing protein [Pseudomonadota bacterium]